MNELQKVFDYSGQQVRTILKDEEVWFVAKDVCEILDLDNVGQAISKLKEEQKADVILNDGRQNRKYSSVNESGLYKLIFKSRKEEAEKFQDWVFEEVLPSIRKTGSYSLQVPKTFSEALRLAADLQEKIELDRPKVEAHDKFISGENYQKVGQVAKVLGIGRNKLFKFLREQKVFMADNTPYQQYIDRGYFVVKEKPITMGEQVINKPQTYVTAKGVDYLSKLVNTKTA